MPVYGQALTQNPQVTQAVSGYPFTAYRFHWSADQGTAVSKLSPSSTPGSLMEYAG